jgi:hypothetical protein
LQQHSEHSITGDALRAGIFCQFKTKAAVYLVLENAEDINETHGSKKKSDSGHKLSELE